jgi:hypothetical protein
MTAAPPATRTFVTLASMVVSSRPSRLVRTSGSNSASPSAARPRLMKGRASPALAMPKAATPAPAVNFRSSRRPITARG